MISENEVWYPIPMYEELYEINKNGEIRSLHKRNFQNLMDQRIDRAGYYEVRLSKGGKNKSKYVHRLLGLTFMDNPDNKCCINHLDGNRLNNELSNLVWATQAENMKHAYDTGLITFVGKCRSVIDECSGMIFESIKKASEYNLIPYSTCKGYLNGNRQNVTCLVYIEQSTRFGLI